MKEKTKHTKIKSLSKTTIKKEEKKMTETPDEPLSPTGRLFMQPSSDEVINCVVAGENPIALDSLKSEISNSLMLKHPRFCSLMLRDGRGREHWRRTAVDVDRHLVVLRARLAGADDDEAVSGYVAGLASSSPLAADKPLWEIHVLAAHNAVVFRVHHALGDGVSLLSLLLTHCRRADDPARLPTVGGSRASAASASALLTRRGWGVWEFVKVVWFTIFYVVEFVLRVAWLSDRRTVVSGGSGVELWPRRLATARFRLADMKIVKRAVPDSTINDVLFGIISSGLSRYLDMRESKGIAMVNLRPHTGLQELSQLMTGDPGSRWGNKFGVILLPVYYHGSESDPLEFVKRSKAMIDKKKLSLEAPFSYKLMDSIISLLGPKLASMLKYRLLCNTTFTVSNVVGPQEEITLAGNPVKYIRPTSSSLPHAITMHMMSYAGIADMQILVAKDVIPDPRVLANCFQDALLELKAAAEAALKS
ncbi:wax ester synthase/diacylglycerol acyltransferase 3-like isoform X2 [Salvia splendens]|uniref:wax ester synthase/diacylglycerol acyltransferase 3-like isoform X2 n=1 Tax=Salvia splendens TaxID=180675 RepID=UPI001C276FCE|nr:wax ester synthase/diacylglycerol acyltransferase 3-like isoform X2 [Salvia splendens]